MRSRVLLGVMMDNT